jgi:hypothetical protein
MDKGDHGTIGQRGKVMHKRFKEWIEDSKEIEHIGKIAFFYLPSKKITKKIRKKIHEFFLSKQNAYTHESGGIEGYWHDGYKLTSDSHDRYEISFKGRKKFKDLIEFLSELCKEMNEKSIYLTIADNSYLVRAD